VLFNSFEFIFIFFPVTLLIFFALGSKNMHRPAMAWLVLSSLFFYGWWNPAYLFLIVFSMLFNYSLGTFLGNGTANPNTRIILILGVVVNIGLLLYFKYVNFFVAQISIATGLSFNLQHVILPLAISFFTFQQVAFLVDSYRNETNEYSFLHYSLFVTFFPQLIAGPIVHHKDMLPQFLQPDRLKINPHNIAIGLSIFAIGLFKKTVIADGVAPYSNIVFDSAASGDPLTFFDAWGGTLAYTFQLYFDFSGYSDMAIGLARMVGIVLPLNFYSPYKALNISEFWRRWHITLSKFLKDYVYITLGGNRLGSLSRYKNLFLTMFIGGMWHGAGWNFVFWGVLHGSYLVSHQLWANLTCGWNLNIPISIKRLLAWSLTFFAVIVGWVFFRATSFDGAVAVLHAMGGGNGISIPNAIMVRMGDLQYVLTDFGIQTYLGGGGRFLYTWTWILILSPIVLTLPNTQDLFFKQQGSLSKKAFDRNNSLWPLFGVIQRIQWQDNLMWAMIISVAFITSIMTLSQVSEFLYFQF